MVTHFTGQLSDGAAQQRTLALLCLGEIGRQTDLSAHKNLVAAVMTGFTMPEEEVKAAASFALGNIASAFAPRFLSFVGLRFLALTVSDQKSVFLAQPLPALA